MSTHLEITHRGQQFLTQASRNNDSHPYYAFYSALLSEMEPFLHAGSFFPDWGYACGADDESEVAHWLPFWNHTIAYIHHTYGTNTTEMSYNGRALLAFLFGMVSHGAADAPWHSLDSNEGFIDALSAYDFGGLYSQAHPHADTGADILLSYSGDLNYFDRVWRVPSADLVNIYQLFGLNVTRLQLDRCMFLGYMGAQLNRAEGHYFYARYAAPSPFLVENYIDYFKGGIVDITMWVVNCWNATIAWLESPSHARPPFCKMFDAGDKIANRQGTYEYYDNQKTKCHGSFMSYVSTTQRQLEDKLRGQLAGKFCVRPESSSDADMTDLRLVSMKTPTKHNGLKSASLSQVAREVAKTRTRDSDSSMRRAFRNLRSCITFILAWGKALGDVLHEAVVAYFQRRLPSCSSSSERETWTISNPYAGFGSSIVSADFSASNRVDIAIGAPYHTSPTSLAVHTGAVFVVSGGRRYANSGGSQDVPAYAVLNGNTSQAGSRFGQSLAIVDLNCDGIPDLAVSSPSYDANELFYNGRVYVFFGRELIGFKTNQSPDLIIQAKQPFPKVPPFREGSGSGTHFKYRYRFTVFGVTLLGADVDGDGCADLIVGSPYASYDGGITAQRGVIHAFYSSSNHTGFRDARLDADWYLPSPSRLDYERFGASLAYIEELKILIVGAPGFALLNEKGRGKVYGFQVKNRTQYPVLKWTVAGVSDLGQLGSSVLTARINMKHHLIVASPSETNSNIPLSRGFLDLPGAGYDYSLRGFQAGAIRIMNIDDLGIGDTTDTIKPLLLIRGSQSSAHLGWKGGIAVNEKMNLLLVAESLVNHEDGRVHVIALSSVGTYDAPHQIPQSVCYDNPMVTRSRLGSNVHFTDFDNDRRLDMIVSSDHGGVSFSGSVTVIYGV
ncbi:glycosylphosphatidylinositol phospholipase D [Synchytrium endobioticum]|uniref:Phosphatidylinositol-glycan-specific phospholipase D n=1 Tax=Synchytrium endobioticum TaxID=286115 RepID=A0A507CSD7_9FUNG|nr:glycosylphosphatidylinositol phospholipase D [Synchytrium endobioticum]